MDMDAIQERLFALQDLKYRQFHAGLMPTIDKERIIGVRMPALRKLARELKGTAEAEAFLLALPHHYYEENNLHGLLLCARSGYEETVAGLEVFLPHVDNWATCDLLSPRAFRAHPPQLPGQIRRWLDSGETYTVRFGLGMLMSLYLDDFFRPEYLDWAAEVRHEDYYVRMMAAWYFATALAKQYDTALPYLTGRRLEQWTHNKTIQKAVESYRITPEQKDALRALRWKNS